MANPKEPHLLQGMEKRTASVSQGADAISAQQSRSRHASSSPVTRWQPQRTPLSPPIDMMQPAVKVNLPSIRTIFALALTIVLTITLSTSTPLTNLLTRTSANPHLRLNDSSFSSSPPSFSRFRSFMSFIGLALPPPPPLPYTLTNLPPSLSDYIQWHAQCRACIEDPSCRDPLPPTLIWRCPINRSCAGIGDRVRGIQFTFLLAVATRRLFFINMPDDPHPFYKVVAPSTLDWRLPQFLIDQRPEDTWPYLNWFDCQRSRLPNGKRRRCRKGNHSPSDDALPHVNLSFPDLNIFKDDIAVKLQPIAHLTIACRLPGAVIEKILNNRQFMHHAPRNVNDLHMDRVRNNRLLQLLIRLLFQPSGNVRAIMNETVPPDFVRAGYVSVHARTGQDVGEQYDDRFEFVNAHMLHAVRELLYCAKLMHPLASKRIYLATDSLQFKYLFSKLATGRLNNMIFNRLTSNETLPLDDIKKFMEEDHEPIDVRYIERRAFHFGLNTPRGRFNNKYSLSSERRKAFLNVFADLFLLAGGDAIVTTGSGFALTAYWLGTAPSIIIAESGNGTDHCAGNLYFH